MENCSQMYSTYTEMSFRRSKGTKAVIILPDWPSFREVTSDLKLLKTIPSRQQIFTKSPDNDASLRTHVDSFRWPVNYWVIDKDTPVLSGHNVREQNVPSDDTTATTETESDEAPPSDIDETEVNPDIIAQDAANKYLPAAAAYVIMNPDHPELLMRVPVKINDQETDALIDNAATLNFVSKSFIDEHEFHEFCAKAPKVAVRVANSQRVASWKVFIPKSLIINGTDYSGIQFRVLPHLKCADIILGLPAQKALDMVIRPKENIVSINGADVSSQSEDRRVSCQVIDCDKLEKVMKKS